jgi:hypothetical protein
MTIMNEVNHTMNRAAVSHVFHERNFLCCGFLPV